MFRRDLLATALTTAALPGLGSRAALAQGAATPSPAPASGAAVRRVHGLSLLGDPSLPPDFAHWPWVNPEAPKGGEMVRTALGSYDSFNPFILRGTSAVGIGLLYETLLMDSSDEASAAYAHLAKLVEVPADNRWVAFELREEARWHDGRPLTAADVAWTFATIME
ncbi:ABC transporter substrate-binding protein, partial [Roseomonas sp. DSM 102946]|nr:ABC transporter substrate-binding protein [Roseomonas sp. DSM 102946]